jgi:hypothetical protein
MFKKLYFFSNFKLIMSESLEKNNKSQNIFYSQSQIYLTQEEQERLDHLILCLKIIANIKEYDKLAIIDDKLCIDAPYILQGIWRKWHGQSRNETLNNIRNIIAEIFDFTDSLLRMNRESKYCSQPISIHQDSPNVFSNTKSNENFGFRESNSCVFSTIMINLDESIKGIQNLKITYLGDTSVCSELDLLISKIHNRIEKIKKILVIRV